MIPKRAPPAPAGASAAPSSCTRPARARVDRSPDIFERLAAWYPVGRVGEPEDIAKVITFMASDMASWVTGQILDASGGWQISPG